MAETRKACEVCGKEGKVCSFEKACSCWYGTPCTNGESIRKHRKAAARTDQTAQGEAGKCWCGQFFATKIRNLTTADVAQAHYSMTGHDIRRVEGKA